MTVTDDGLHADERTLASELAAEEALKRAKDVLLTEAVNILGDEIELLKPTEARNDLTALMGSMDARTPHRENRTARVGSP